MHQLEIKGLLYFMFTWPCISTHPRNENQFDELFILSLFRQSTSTCFGRICSPSSGGILYTGCAMRNGQNFGRVFLMLNYTDITQNTYIQSWTATGIMAIEKCGLLGCPRTVRRPWRHSRTLRMPGNQIPLANIIMQWPWRDNGSAAACVNYLET